jgi:hypothetical protein
MITAAQKQTKSEFGIFQSLGNFPNFWEFPKLWENLQTLGPKFGKFPKIWQRIQISIVLRTCVKCAASCLAETAARRSGASEVSCRRRSPG